MDIAAMAASPYAPAAMFSKTTDMHPSPCRDNDGVPPANISLR